ncbi:MAG: KH domain-containing protein [Candidatus Dojkabacteria bacterium]|nr:MAG: KH domain-containing protein [Candidatus Dojkabacteria bacterium]
MKELVEYIVRQIVENPDSVVINETVDETGKIMLEIHTDPADTGIVIGKQGKNINAIRSLVKIKAIKEGKFVDVKVPSSPRPDAALE